MEKEVEEEKREGKGKGKGKKGYTKLYKRTLELCGFIIQKCLINI